MRSTERLRLKTGRGDHKEELTALEPRRAEEEAGGHRCKDWALKAAPQDLVVPSRNNVLESFFPMVKAVPLL